MKYEPSIDIGTLQQDYIEIRTKDSVVKIPNDLHLIRKVKRILEMEEQELQEKETQTKKDKELLQKSKVYHSSRIMNLSPIEEVMG